MKLSYWKVAIILCLVAIATLAFSLRDSSSSSASFKTAVVRRGDLLVSISATGTVEPEEVVDVGAQVAGMIRSFGSDQAGKTIDYGSEVDEGTVLARIDDSLYSADVASAEAQIKRAKADLLQYQAKLVQAERNWKRAQTIGPSAALSQTTYDTYLAEYDSAKANYAVGEAAVAQAEAAYRKARRNLDYCVIASPVKGVIIDRRVNIGQTVVASLNAPSLFLIAKDLRKMQVWIAVNEADIGSISPGQPVSFTVDAFPGEEFYGQVRKVRLNAQMTQNVVTYVVEVSTDNSSGKLLPYLTANARFEVKRRNGVLLVPNAALRWTPAKELVAADVESPLTEKKKQGSAGSAENGVVWFKDGNYVRPVAVKLGGTDGSLTEIESAEVKEGDEVVTGTVEVAAAVEAQGKSPFTPQMPRPR